MQSILFAWLPRRIARPTLWQEHAAHALASLGLDNTANQSQITTLLVGLLADSDSSNGQAVAAMAAEALHRMSMPGGGFDLSGAVDGAIRALDDPSDAVRIPACHALANLRSTAASDALVRIVSEGDAASVDLREAALTALGNIHRGAGAGAAAGASAGVTGDVGGLVGTTPAPSGGTSSPCRSIKFGAKGFTFKVPTNTTVGSISKVLQVTSP